MTWMDVEVKVRHVEKRDGEIILRNDSGREAAGNDLTERAGSWNRVVHHYDCMRKECWST